MKNLSFFRKIPIFLLYIAIALLAFSDSGIQTFILVEVGPGSRALRLIAFWLLLFKIALTKYTKKEFFVLMPFSILAMYNYHISGDIIGIYTILVIASLKNIDYSVFFKILFFSTLSSVIILGILSCCNIGSPTHLTQDFGRGLVETRYCFGFYHPNIWHQAIGRCVVFGCIGYYRQLNIVHLLALLLLNGFVYKMSISRTGFIAISIFLILIIFYKYLENFMHTLFVKICTLCGMLGIYGIYIFFTAKLAGKYDAFADYFSHKFTTGRLHQALEFFSIHSIKLFSSRFPDDGTIFDCGFFRIFYECGYLWAWLFFLAMFALVIVTMKYNWDIIIPVVVYFVLCSLYEFTPVTRPTYNVVTLLLPLLIFMPLKDSLLPGVKNV